MTFPRMSARGVLALAALTAVAALFYPAVPAGWAQMGHQPPGADSGMQPRQPAPAVIDTATAALDFSALEVAPAQVHTVQDTVLFGDLFHLVLDFPEVSDAVPEIPLAAGGDWFVPENARDQGVISRLLGGGTPGGPDLGDLPVVPEGTRYVVSFRVYRTNPFQVQAGAFMSPVIQVRGRVEGTADTAPIRSPRPVRWSPWIALGLIAFLVLVLVIGRLLWARGRDQSEWVDREIPGPAWLTASVELRDLLGKGFLNRGESRPFLDGLAGITRRFVAGRYRIAGQEMTGREILEACGDLGYLSPHPGVFGRLIDSVDHHRYNPETPSPGWCRDQAVLFFAEIGRVRVLPRYSEVSAGVVGKGEKAWKDLGRELAAGTIRRNQANPITAGGEK